jgi:hypothetical protein
MDQKISTIIPDIKQYINDFNDNNAFISAIKNTGIDITSVIAEDKS